MHSGRLTNKEDALSFTHTDSLESLLQILAKQTGTPHGALLLTESFLINS